MTFIDKFHLIVLLISEYILIKIRITTTLSAAAVGWQLTLILQICISVLKKLDSFFIFYKHCVAMLQVN